MANNVLMKYGSTTTITCAVASLANDNNLLAGIESSIIDNTSDGFDDIIVSGFVTTGTGPSAKQIEVWAVAWDSNSWPDVFDGTSSSETITSSEIKSSICKPVSIMITNTTSDRKYHFTGVSLKTTFGGCLPSKCVLFVVHNTQVNLNSTAGNHEFRYQGVYPQVQ